MELVPIIYQILIFVAVLLFLVLAVSYIISRTKKSHSTDDGLDLVGSRITQLAYISQRPVGNSHLVPVQMNNRQPSLVERSKQNSPNIKVIRRSNSIKTSSTGITKAPKTNYYPKTKSTKFTSYRKQRYTILNDGVNDNNEDLLKYSNVTTDDSNTKLERFANFR